MKVFLAGLSLILILGTDAFGSENLADAIVGGDVELKFRYRFEYVDQDGFDESAKASTLLTRLNYQTREWQGLSFLIEVDNVSEFIFDNFNSGAGTTSAERATRFPVVADPDGTEFNQVWLQYAFTENFSTKIGRQRILLDNQRFVGGVGWRQNEQTYDGVSVTAKAGIGRLFLAYVYNVNRIFGDKVPAGDHDQNTVLTNFSLPLNEQLKATAYYYGIDNNDAPGFSTRTVGLYLSGEHPLGENMFNWRVEWANQSDNSNNPVDFNSNYFRLHSGMVFSGIKLEAGLELLEGDRLNSGTAFRTPLATLHAFNGRADQFLVTPDDGLQDLSLGISGQFSAFKWDVVAHHFSAEASGRNFGWELDASLRRNFYKRYSLLLQGAFFDADDAAFNDTTKLWLMLTAVF